MGGRPAGESPRAGEEQWGQQAWDCCCLSPGASAGLQGWWEGPAQAASHGCVL